MSRPRLHLVRVEEPARREPLRVRLVETAARVALAGGVLLGCLAATLACAWALSLLVRWLERAT
jgi:uncharacterized iron-regulated membrane protein